MRAMLSIFHLETVEERLTVIVSACVIIMSLFLATVQAETRRPNLWPDNAAIRPAEEAPGKVGITDQSNKRSEVSIVASARQRLVRDETLSSSGKNVRLILPEGGGKVVLQGPVASPDERQRVEQIVAMAVRPLDIRSELEVAAR